MNRLTQIRQLPCVRCQAPAPSQACHANWGEFGKGMGIKADDSYTIPLCHDCHVWLDQYQEMDRGKAREWFLERLEFTNNILAEQDSPSNYLF